MKYLLPLVPLGLVFISVALAKPDAGPAQVTSEVETKTDSKTAASEQPKVDVTVNGRPVPVPSNGTATVKTDDATVTVSGHHQTTAGGQTATGSKTVTTSDDGSVNITVESRTTNSDTRTRTRYRGGTEKSFSSSSKLNVTQQ
ncbi:hypothetical protein KY386_03470 [Candidatus Parcubacteria bacterium]|nr:hypothetical protein [Candidatus Parcubacteria bacterium]